MVTYTYIYIYMFSSYLPIVRVCLVRQAMLSGSEMKVLGFLWYNVKYVKYVK